MKRLIFILFVFISIVTFGQTTYPITQTMGAPNSMVISRGAGGAKDGLIITQNQADTTTANLQLYLKYTAGIIIRTGTPSTTALWIRNDALTAWIQVGGGGGGSVTASNGLTAVASDVQLYGDMTQDDTIKTHDHKFVITNLGVNPGLTIELGNSGTGSNGIVKLNQQGLQGTGFMYLGKDPGFVKDNVENTITPAEAAAVAIPYAASLSGYAFKLTNANITGQLFNAVGGNTIADSALVLRVVGGAGMNFIVDGVGYIAFRGNATPGISEYGRFQALTGRLGINTANASIGQRLTVTGSGMFSDSLLLTALLTGTTSDSVLVTSGAVTKRILQSSLVGVNIYNSDGNLTANRTVNGSNLRSITFDSVTSFLVKRSGVIRMQMSSTQTNIQSATAGASVVVTGDVAQISGGVNNTTNTMQATRDSLGFNPYLGQMNIDSLRLGNAGDSVMTWGGAGNGKWGHLAQSSIAAGSVAWNNITNPTGTQTLAWDDAELNAWTNGSNTETFLTVDNNSLTTGTGELWRSSSLTTGSLASFTGTSTALASGNALVKINSSGINGTNAIPATGLDISVINTNVTSGTNIAANFKASGATTTNWALFTGSATGGDGRVNINNATNDALHTVVIKSIDNTATHGIKILSNNETSNLTIGYQTLTTNGGMILNSSATGIQIASRLYVGASGTSPTALIHTLGGTTAASSAPLKFTTGTSMTVAEAGAVEYTTDDLFFTISTGTARKRFMFADAVGGLTSGRVPYVTTNGRLLDAAGFLFDGTSLLTLGVNTTTLGKIKLFGNTSGDATIQPAAVAGTATVLTLPAATGTLATLAGTETFTNKRWTARVGSTTSNANPTINTDNTDIYELTAQTVNITSFTTNLSGTPVDGDMLEIEITGTAARSITWGTSFVASTVALPTTTVTTNTLSVVFQFFTTSSYGNSKWVCVQSF